MILIIIFICSDYLSDYWYYIIMKKTPHKNRTDEITTMLFEQDANSLGLNVIWCSDYSEIPDILFKIAK